MLGAGPAGLAAAFFLAREGWAVTVFEGSEPAEPLRQDRRHLAELGVAFRREADRGALQPAVLRARGFGPLLVDLSAPGGGPPAGSAAATELAGVYRVGDPRAGCRTAVRCIADARRAVAAIGREERRPPSAPASEAAPGAGPDAGEGAEPPSSPQQLALRRATVRPSALSPGGPSSPTPSTEEAAAEAERCLECGTACNRCVDVCPNRANLAVAGPDEAGWSRPFQIVHLAGWCNECGDCAASCPYPGARPWRDKLTLFPDGPSFGAAQGYGFLLRELPGGRPRAGPVGRGRRPPAAPGGGGPAALPEQAPGEDVDSRLSGPCGCSPSSGGTTVPCSSRGAAHDGAAEGPRRWSSIPPSVREDVDIRIDGPLIAAIGLRPEGVRPADSPEPAPADPAPAREILLDGALVTPGLVCAHHHLYSVLSRGLLAAVGPCPGFPLHAAPPLVAPGPGRRPAHPGRRRAGRLPGGDPLRDHGGDRPPRLPLRHPRLARRR